MLKYVCDSASVLRSATTLSPPIRDKTFAHASPTTRCLVEYSSGVRTNLVITGTAAVSKTDEMHECLALLYRTRLFVT